MSKARLIEKNMLVRCTILSKHIDDVDVFQNAGVTMINSHRQSDMFNIVCVENVIDDDEISKIIQTYNNESVPFAWWYGFEGQEDTLEKQLKAHGLHQSEEELAMVLEENQFQMPNPIDALDIQTVNTQEKLETFIKIICKLLPDEAKAIESYYHAAADYILSEHSPMQLFIGLLDGQPASTCSVYPSEHVAGIYDVITLPEYRGRKIATAMTGEAARYGFSTGADYVVLTATDTAKAVYEKMGFKSVKLFSVYIPKEI